jgi:hypothetical protein
MKIYNTKVLYNGLTLCLIPTDRKPIVLCRGTLCETERFIGLHCRPNKIGTTKGRLAYCFLMETNNTNSYPKIIVEKRDKGLIIWAKLETQNFTEVFLQAYFDYTNVADIRAALMLDSGTFVYDSIKQFANDIHEYKTSYVIEWIADHATFVSLYS